MVHVRFSESYINITFIYMAYNIFPVLPIKDLINKYGYPTAPFKLATGKKPSISYLRVSFFPCVVRKVTANFGIKELNMIHQAQEGFWGIFVGIPQHQKWYLVYVPHKQKITCLYNFFLMRVYLVIFSTHQNYIQKIWICNRMCNTYLMLHLKSKKKR